MKNNCSLFTLLLMLFLPLRILAKPIVHNGNLGYEQLRNQYEKKAENDESALPLVRLFLAKAKKEKNYEKILEAYENMIFYSARKVVKLSLTDSSVNYALKSKNNELISSAYLEKGVIYYFFYKNYQSALNEYLKAYEFSKDIKDQYLKHRIAYQLGVVKSYLGYYKEALKLFDECVAYFEPLTHANVHPNIILNNQKGYFNTLHQQIVCYRSLNTSNKSDSLLQIGLSRLPQSKEFDLEKSYFLKSRGIADYRNGNYNEAIVNLNNSLRAINKIDDFSWASVCYFYIGKSYLGLDRKNLAISYFKKIDSVFQKHAFIHPEVRANFEILIDHYHQTKNNKEELYFTKQLLKVDSALNKDFKYLSAKIYKEYDEKALLDKQKQLEIKNSFGFVLLVSAVALLVVLSVILVHRNRKEKEIHTKYLLLEKRILEQVTVNEKLINILPQSNTNKVEVPNDVANIILKKLSKFEENKGYLKKGLTLSALAKKFETNTTYLSQVVNEYKGDNFNRYLNRLRIEFITEQLYHHSKYLTYSIEGLAEYSGISSRQNFSDLFSEMNGIRPTDFIKRRREELNKDTA